MNGAAPGWYPLPNDPATERYWNGTVWTEHHRPRPSVPAPPSSGGGGTSKIVLGVVLGVLLVFGGCVASTVILVDSTVDTFETLTVTTLQDDGQPGSFTDPYPLGASHAREPGLSGSGWTVSVDQIRDIGDGCLAVIGTATLDTLVGERTFSLSSSFPEIELVDASETVDEPDTCNRADLATEGLLWAQNLEVVEDFTFEWFETFEAERDSFRYVSVSGTLYSG